jgi:DNA-directed RNA polymerase specialized sigma24 family protein
MNEINNAVSSVFILFEATINQMIDKRVEAKVVTLTERIDALEKTQAPAPSTQAAFDFESYEFRAAVVKVIDNHTMGDEFLNPLIEALAASDKFNDEINEAAHKAASDAAEEVMDTHNNDYNHDDIHEMSDMDEDAVREIVQESMRDTVNDLLDGATVSIRV